MAGTSSNNIQGANSKNLLSVAYPKSRRLESGKTNRNKPFNKRKTIMAIYPVRLLKNCLNSFLQTDHMNTKIGVYRFKKEKRGRRYVCQIFSYIRPSSKPSIEKITTGLRLLSIIAETYCIKDPSDTGGFLFYTAKLSPHAQVLLAFGLLK